MNCLWVLIGKGSNHVHLLGIAYHRKGDQEVCLWVMYRCCQTVSKREDSDNRQLKRIPCVASHAKMCDSLLTTEWEKGDHNHDQTSFLF